MKLSLDGESRRNVFVGAMEGEDGDRSSAGLGWSWAAILSLGKDETPVCSTGLLVVLIVMFPLCSASAVVETLLLLSDGVLAPDLTLFGPRTLPSFAYSHTKPRFIQRLHDGCSPLHFWESGISADQLSYSSKHRRTFAFRVRHFSHACAVRKRGCSGVR